MKVTLDENLGARGAHRLQRGGCDVATVAMQGLCSASDQHLAEVCRQEGRVSITPDKDFASVLRFPPSRFAGLVVLRLPEPLTPATIDEALTRIPSASRSRDLTGQLWVVDAQRVREFADDSDPF